MTLELDTLAHINLAAWAAVVAPICTVLAGVVRLLMRLASQVERFRAEHEQLMGDLKHRQATLAATAGQIKQQTAAVPQIRLDTSAIRRQTPNPTPPPD